MGDRGDVGQVLFGQQVMQPAVDLTRLFQHPDDEIVIDVVPKCFADFCNNGRIKNGHFK